jgi:hypothetical protein
VLIVKLVLKGLQDVTVELLGVLVVVWALFGFATCLKSAVGADPVWSVLADAEKGGSLHPS